MSLSSKLKKSWRQPWFWVSVLLAGSVQFFTVNTAPFNVQQKHQQQRVPAQVFDPRPTEVVKDVAGDARLVVMSWNVRALSRPNADLDRAAIVMGDADVVVLQDVDLTMSGKGQLGILAGLIESRTHAKFCYAWTLGNDGNRMAYGFLWRESNVGYLDALGNMHDGCSPVPLTIRQDRRLHAGVHASFYAKNPRRVFELATVELDKRPKSAGPVNEIFLSVGDRNWPVLVAADFKISSGDTAMNDVLKNGYRFAFDSGKRAGHATQQNIWYRNGDLASAGTINLFERFGDSRHEDIEQGLSDQFPLAVELKTTSEGHDELTSTLITKTKSPAPASAPGPASVATPTKKKKVAARPIKPTKPKRKVAHVKVEKPKPRVEDLEDETKDADKVVDDN